MANRGKRTTQLRLVVDADLYDRLRKDAEAQRRKVGDQLSIILQHHYEGTDDRDHAQPVGAKGN